MVSGTLSRGYQGLKPVRKARGLAQTPGLWSLRSRRDFYLAMSDAEIEKHLCASRPFLPSALRNKCNATLQDLAALPGNHFEALKGDRKGQFSIRINDRWRICFEWEDGARGPSNVEIVDYH